MSLELGGQRVLRGIDLRLPAGSHWLLVGANGAGKSQLMKILAGERWPTPEPRSTRTYTTVDGTQVELRELSPRLQLVSAEQQDRYERYDWNFTVSAVVGTGCRGLRAPLGPLTPSQRARVQHCLRRLGLEALRRRRFLGLSYGQRRLVLIARALAARPALLLLDEVYNGLDRVHRRRLDRVLDALYRTRLTVVVTAHRGEDARPGLTNAIVLERGRVRYAGTRAALPQRYAHHVAPASVPSTAELLPASRVKRPRRGALVVLEAVSVYRDYRPVLKDLNWTVGGDEHWAVLGPNASGKTTLLNLLYGTLWAADGGRVLRRGHAAGQRVEDWQARVRFLSPDGHVECLARRTLLDVVLSARPALRRLAARPTAADRAAALAALDRVGLAALAGRAPREVSYGQLRLTLLARALVWKPEALLLDEPLTGLDASTRQRMRAELVRAAADGTQLVMAVHHADDVVPVITHTLTLPSGRRRVYTPPRKTG